MTRLDRDLAGYADLVGEDATRSFVTLADGTEMTREFAAAFLSEATDQEPREGSSSPWGRIDFVTPLAEGAVFVETPSHGGVWLSPAMRNRVPDEVKATNFLGDDSWWEEDEDAMKVMRALGIPLPAGWTSSSSARRFARFARSFAAAELQAGPVADFEGVSPYGFVLKQDRSVYRGACAAVHAAGQPDWLKERVNDPHGTPRSSSFWTQVQAEEVGSQFVFERDGRWYVYSPRYNSWWNFDSREDAVTHASGGDMDVWGARRKRAENTPEDAEINALFRQLDELKAQGREGDEEYMRVLKDLKSKTDARNQRLFMFGTPLAHKLLTIGGAEAWIEKSTDEELATDPDSPYRLCADSGERFGLSTNDAIRAQQQGLEFRSDGSARPAYRTSAWLKERSSRVRTSRGGGGSNYQLLDTAGPELSLDGDEDVAEGSLGVGQPVVDGTSSPDRVNVRDGGRRGRRLGASSDDLLREMQSYLENEGGSSDAGDLWSDFEENTENEWTEAQVQEALDEGERRGLWRFEGNTMVLLKLAARRAATGPTGAGIHPASASLMDTMPQDMMIDDGGDDEPAPGYQSPGTGPPTVMFRELGGPATFEQVVEWLKGRYFYDEPEAQDTARRWVDTGLIREENGLYTEASVNSEGLEGEFSRISNKYGISTEGVRGMWNSYSDMLAQNDLGQPSIEDFEQRYFVSGMGSKRAVALREHGRRWILSGYTPSIGERVEYLDSTGGKYEKRTGIVAEGLGAGSWLIIPNEQSELVPGEGIEVLEDQILRGLPNEGDGLWGDGVSI